MCLFISSFNHISVNSVWVARVPHIHTLWPTLQRERREVGHWRLVGLSGVLRASAMGPVPFWVGSSLPPLQALCPPSLEEKCALCHLGRAPHPDPQARTLTLGGQPPGKRGQSLRPYVCGESPTTLVILSEKLFHCCDGASFLAPSHCGLCLLSTYPHHPRFCLCLF